MDEVRVLCASAFVLGTLVGCAGASLEPWTLPTGQSHVLAQSTDLESPKIEVFALESSFEAARFDVNRGRRFEVLALGEPLADLGLTPGPLTPRTSCQASCRLRWNGTAYTRRVDSPAWDPQPTPSESMLGFLLPDAETRCGTACPTYERIQSIELDLGAHVIMLARRVADDGHPFVLAVLSNGRVLEVDERRTPREVCAIPGPTMTAGFEASDGALYAGSKPGRVERLTIETSTCARRPLTEVGPEPIHRLFVRDNGRILVLGLMGAVGAFDSGVWRELGRLSPEPFDETLGLGFIAPAPRNQIVFGAGTSQLGFLEADDTFRVRGYRTAPTGNDHMSALYQGSRTLIGHSGYGLVSYDGFAVVPLSELSKLPGWNKAAALVEHEGFIISPIRQRSIAAWSAFTGFCALGGPGPHADEVSAATMLGDDLILGSTDNAASAPTSKAATLGFIQIKAPGSCPR